MEPGPNEWSTCWKKEEKKGLSRSDISLGIDLRTARHEPLE